MNYTYKDAMLNCMDTMMVIADRVRELRRDASLDQQALADRARVSMQTVSNLETGRLQDIKISTLSRLAGALGVSPVDLLTRSKSRAA